MAEMNNFVTSAGRSRILKKALIVSLGYCIAFAGAGLAVYIWEGMPDVQSHASSGMFAFGEALLFIGVFCLIAVAPTGLALYFIACSMKRGRQKH